MFRNTSNTEEDIANIFLNSSLQKVIANNTEHKKNIGLVLLVASTDLLHDETTMLINNYRAFQILYYEIVRSSSFPTK